MASWRDLRLLHSAMRWANEPLEVFEVTSADPTDRRSIDDSGPYQSFLRQQLAIETFRATGTLWALMMTSEASRLSAALSPRASIRRREVDAPTHLELYEHAATLDLWLPDESEPPNVDALRMLRDAVAEALDVHPCCIDWQFRELAEWRPASIAAYDLPLAAIEAIADELSADSRWQIGAVAATGGKAQGSEFEATELIGMKVGQLYGVFYDGDVEAEEAPDILYFVPSNSKRFHRMFIDAGLFFWDDYGRVAPDDIDEGSAFVDYVQRWNLDGRTVSRAQVHEDRLHVAFDDGLLLTFLPADPSDIDSEGILRITEP